MNTLDLNKDVYRRVIAAISHGDETALTGQGHNKQERAGQNDGREAAARGRECALPSKNTRGLSTPK